MKQNNTRSLLSISISVMFLTSCFRPFESTVLPSISNMNSSAIIANADESNFVLPTINQNIGSETPTPDAPHLIPTPRTNYTSYTVQWGDTLHSIAGLFLLDTNQLVLANPGIDPNWLEVGQVLQIPPVISVGTAPGFKIAPDSELIFSPYTALFDIEQFCHSKYGYLSTYSEEVDGVWLKGFQIVDRVAREYSVNPRILLALLEYQSHWVTQTNIPNQWISYPMSFFDIYKDGLYKQLAWAANSLNSGYYSWEQNAISFWFLLDGSAISVNPEINAGTAGIQYIMSLLYGFSDWNVAVSEQGFYATYTSLFGSPFTYAYDPLLPDGLNQPELQLPFEIGSVWSFTGGPHAGWGDGSPWAALDFAPPGEPMGCQISDAWVTAVADGIIIRSENGVVILDIDGDGFEQTGWTILYLHIDMKDRIPVGAEVLKGERIGHPSCEGGFSNGTHVHIARRYNGLWVSADSAIPFVLDGWVAQSDGLEYNGFLTKNDQSMEAWDAFVPENQISR